MARFYRRAGNIARTELRLVGLRQAHLSDRSRGLQLIDLVRTLGPAESQHAFGDRAARHEQHLAAVGHEAGDLLGPALDGARIQAPPLVGDQGAAHLDDDAPRGEESGTRVHRFRPGAVPGVGRQPLSWVGTPWT